MYHLQYSEDDQNQSYIFYFSAEMNFCTEADFMDLALH